MSRPNLEIFFPPLFCIDQEKPFSFCLSAFLKAYLGCNNILSKVFSGFGEEFHHDLNNPTWHLAFIPYVNTSKCVDV